MFKLASLFVEIKANDDALQKQVGALQPQLSALGVAIGIAAGGLAVAAIEKAASALTGFISRGISGAADLGESLSKIGTTFGPSADLITGLADEMAAKFGTVKGPLLEGAANLGQIAKGAGMAQDAAAGLSRDLTKLAADAASFHNTSFEVALDKIRAGLSGESEPLRAFGVLLTEEAVAAEAVAMGLAKSAKELDNQAKMAARASLITKGLADANGDLERTADSTSNQWRKLTGTLENMAVELGASLMPAINSLLNATTGLIEYARPGFESLKAAFATFSDFVVEAVGTIGVVWRNLADEWEIVTIKATAMGQNLMAIFAAIPANLAIIGGYIADNWRELIVDAVTAVGTAFMNLVTNLTNLGSAIGTFLADPTQGFSFEWTPLLDGFKKTADALPELIKPALVSMDDEIDAVAGRIADREGKRAQDVARKAAPAAAAGKSVAAAAAKKAADFKSETSGVSEFALKLREGIYNQDKDDTAKKALLAAEKTAKATEKTAEQLGALAIARMA